MAKIKYSKKRLRSNSKMGLVFLAIGVIFILLSFIIPQWKEISLASIGIGQLAVGIFMFVKYYFENSKQYLTIKNGELIKNTLFPKKIKLADIDSIKEFAGDLRLLTQKTEFIIDTQIIEPNSLLKLKSELKNYGLK